jgi:hypothetical protein
MEVTEMEICVHGNSGHVQDSGAGAVHCGWGIDYDVAGTGSWLQYAIPVNAGTMIKSIRVFFSKDGPHYKDGWVRHVHIYDGPNIVKKLEDLYLGKGDVNRAVNKVLGLGEKPIQFNHGIGVSIMPETKDVDGLKAIVNFEFHSVCAITP